MTTGIKVKKVEKQQRGSMVGKKYREKNAENKDDTWSGLKPSSCRLPIAGRFRIRRAESNFDGSSPFPLPRAGLIDMETGRQGIRTRRPRCYSAIVLPNKPTTAAPFCPIPKDRLRFARFPTNQISATARFSLINYASIQAGRVTNRI